MALQVSDKTVSDPLIHQICAGLSRYYKLKGVDYDAIFSEYCADNGMDDDGVTDDLTFAVEDLTLDFDDDDFETFPFPDDIDEDEKQAFVFNVLKECASDANAYPLGQSKKVLKVYPTLEVKAEHWDLSTKDVAAAKALYKEQLRTLFDAGMGQDKAILRLLAVGRKLQAPYLLYLADAYIRTKVDSGDEKMSVTNCALKSKHFKALGNLRNGEKIRTDTIGGIKSFFARINPEMMLIPTSRIVGDVEKCARLILSASKFVHNRASQKGVLACPFQFDVCFIYKDKKETFDEVSDEEEEDDEEEKKPQTEWFGDIEAKLEAENLRNAMSKLTVDARGFTAPFKKFVAEKGMKGKGDEAYPHRRRFCAMVDFRNGGVENDLFFYEPPKNCNEFPDGEYVQLWYFDGPKTCILPAVGYNAGQVAQIKALNTGSTCDGKMLTFSFHAEAEDCIRCYMYSNGQMMRFMPKDILTVLPKFFVAEDKKDEDEEEENKDADADTKDEETDAKDEENQPQPQPEFGADNEEWVKTDEAEKVVQEMEQLIVDARFNAFYESF